MIVEIIFIKHSLFSLWSHLENLCTSNIPGYSCSNVRNTPYLRFWKPNCKLKFLTHNDFHYLQDLNYKCNKDKAKGYFDAMVHFNIFHCSITFITPFLTHLHGAPFLYYVYTLKTNYIYLEEYKIYYHHDYYDRFIEMSNKMVFK